MNDNRNSLISILSLEKYPYAINLYREIPEFEIPLNCFEEYAIKRINIYNAISNCKFKEQQNPLYSKKVIDCIEQNLPLLPNGDLDCIHENSTLKFKQRQIDHASYYILLLLCYEDVYLREWVIKCEIEFFHIRLKYLEQNEKLDFIKSLNFNFIQQASPQEYNEYKYFYPKTECLYKVPFEYVTDIVRSREVILKKGYAYILPKDVDYIVMYFFNKILIENITLVEKSAILVRDDYENVFSLLQPLKKKCQYDTNNWKNGIIHKQGIRHTDIEYYAKYFPPCMNFLFKKLKEKNHLKFDGRMQFGLFLKCGVGLSLAESLLFWEKAFQPKFDTIEFNRNYAYNIRHNYGKEGSRIDYTSMDCQQIQNHSEPKSFDHYHGCPFKHFSTTNLIDYLNFYIRQYRDPSNSIISSTSSFSSTSTSFSTNSQDILPIMSLVSQKSYCKACSCLLQLVQGGGYSYYYSNTSSIDTQDIITSPDNYFLSNFNYFIRNYTILHIYIE